MKMRYFLESEDLRVEKKLRVVLGLYNYKYPFVVS